MYFLSLLGQTTYDNAYTSADTNAIMTMIVFTLATLIVLYAVQSYLIGRIFQKAGVASWKAWVPIYNSWVLLELGGQQGFWAVLAIVPVVNIISAVFMYIAMYHIGLNLGKSGAFILIAIFLPLIWLVWLALDDSRWLPHDTTSAQPNTAPAYQPPVDPNDK